MNWIKKNILVSLILFACICYLVIYVNEVRQWLFYPNQIDYGEGYLQYINKMWTDGTWKWDIFTPPYIPLMYGIGFPSICYPLVKIFGNQLWIGRAVEVASLVVILIMLYKIVVHITKNRAYGIISATLPLTQPIVRDWSLQYRIDMFAVMIGIVGLWFIVKYKDSKWIYASIPIFTVAVLTKILILGGIGAIGLYLLIHNRKRFMWYALLMGLSLAVCFGTLILVTGGGYVWNVFLSNLTTNVWYGAPTVIANQISLHSPMIAIDVLAIVYVITEIRHKRFGIIPLYCICAYTVDIVASLRPGGFINYFLEMIFGLCLCATLLLPKIVQKTTEDYTVKKKVLASGFIVAVLFIEFLTINTHTSFPFPNKQYDNDINIAKQIIEDTNEPVITENTGLVVNMNKDIYIEFFIMTNLNGLGMWDDTNYLNDYRNQKFDYIIMRIPAYKRLEGDGHFPDKVVKLINENYTLIYDPPENFYWYGISVYESKKKLATDDRPLIKELVSEYVK